MYNLGWKDPRFSNMNPIQELYLDELGIGQNARELGNKYCAWSAKLTVQNISQHCKEAKEIRSHMGMGQPLSHTYQARPEREPKENIRNKTIGFLTEGYKIPTRSKRS